MTTKREWDVPKRDLLDIERESQAERAEQFQQWGEDVGAFLRHLDLFGDETDYDTALELRRENARRAANLLNRKPK
jgi:hypothetical protein